ncbi:MAG: pirin family protein [Gammaproteobacteria bacterium]|nr:pirin family protein [Gammaproteobacteria bacterium]
MTVRTVLSSHRAVDTSDGAGVKLKRALGQHPGARLDPFLMLDFFSSDDPDDYIEGFPAHPHRGFETVTYIVDGHMLHEDHLGNRGDLKAGGVQWMTAGRGIIHSEMPQQTAGLLRGFQLWINLPAKEKMKPAGYRDIPAEEIPVITAPGARVKLVAGVITLNGTTTTGPINGLSTEPLYADVALDAGASLTLPVKAGLNAFLYVFEGAVLAAGTQVPIGGVAILDNGDELSLSGGPNGGRVLLVAGRAIGEPVAQYGPFVMNTREELETAVNDYRAGRLTA